MNNAALNVGAPVSVWRRFQVPLDIPWSCIARSYGNSVSNSFQDSELCYERVPTVVVMHSRLSHAGVRIILLLSSLHKSCGGGGRVKISTGGHWNPRLGAGCVTGRDSVLPPVYLSIAGITIYHKPRGLKQPPFSVSQFPWVKGPGRECLPWDQGVSRLDSFPRLWRKRPLLAEVVSRIQLFVLRPGSPVLCNHASNPPRGLHLSSPCLPHSNFLFGFLLQPPAGNALSFKGSCDYTEPTRIS